MFRSSSYLLYYLSIYLFLSSFLFCFSSLANASEVNVYSARKEALIKPLLDRFTEETGIQVNLVTGNGDTLLTRLKAEGKNSPADILITSDAGRLHRAREANVLQPVDIPALNTIITESQRDKEGYWYGLSLRARVIVYAADRVKEEELSSYEDLADPRWKQRICVRSSNNIYNQSLVASLIENLGLKDTEEWLSGFVENLARPPQGGDRDQIKAVAAGQCDIAVINNYYLGAMLASDDESEKIAAEKVTLLWPNQNNRGTHMNISGAGITQSAPHKESAIALLSFLASEKSQQWYAQVNNEYPIREGVAISEVLQSWGQFKPDPLPVEKLGKLNAEAVKAMDRANWK